MIAGAQDIVGNVLGQEGFDALVDRLGAIHVAVEAHERELCLSDQTSSSGQHNKVIILYHSSAEIKRRGEYRAGWR